MVGALNPSVPYAHLAVHGEQGSGKSSLLRLLRAFVDPAKAEENTDPRSIDDFMVTCLNNHIVSYDNLSGLSDWFSDALCRISTGAGLTKRMLYSDFDEVVIEAARPAILNGMVSVVHRPDLLERTILLELPRIESVRRLPERYFERQLAQVAPQVFGALLDVIVTALGRVDTVQLPTLPRMADFVLWVEAAAPALGWAEGEFLAAYEANTRTKEEQVLEADEVAETLLAWAQVKLPTVTSEHAITLKQLLTELSALRLAGNDPRLLASIAPSTRLPAEWPDSGRALMFRLARAQPLLRQWGLEYSRGERKRYGQLYVFTRSQANAEESA
jgi:putative DNA primase/helicase